jgi:signal transduction histidine kinase/ligand-binding sensor domain-containing protein
LPRADSNPTTSSTRAHLIPVPTTSPHLRGLVRLLALLLTLASTVGALEPTTPLAAFSRQSWVMENGLPQNTVQALAQTTDGFLWIGTEVGLVRFDGNTFLIYDQNSKPIALPGNDITCLFPAHDGSLWIGTTSGLARLKDGQIKSFTTADGLPGNGVRDIGQNPDESIWVSAGGETAQFNGKHFDKVEVVDHARANPNIIQTLSLPGESYAYATTATVTTGRDKKSEIHLAIGKDLPGSRIQSLYGDNAGALWIGTNAGLVRYASGKLDRFPLTDPLATASILSILQDHEGNLWVGTETGGLHILRDERFRTLGTRDGLSSDATTTVVEDAAGTLWVGTSGYGLDAVIRSGPAFIKTKTYTAQDGLTSDIILSLAAAPAGDLWVGTPDGLNRIRHGAITTFTTADGLPDDFIRSLHVDPDGSLWIGTRRGLAHLTLDSSLHIDTYTQATGLGSDLVGAMARDTNGNLWVATLAGLSRLAGGPEPFITNFTSANGLSSNVITALLPRSNGTLLIGTQDHGWNLWDGHHFSPVARTGLSRTTIHAILDDSPGSPATGPGRPGGNEGHLWFATANGIARCNCDMKGGFSHWMEFGPADGLRTRQMATNSHPSAWRSRDGLLWFATPKGLVEVDPAHFPVNTVPPPVALIRFAVDDIEQPLVGSSLRVPAGHNHFQFDYAALSFTAPQKVHYRYMLEGFDHQWTEAGPRRSAYYTSIPPGPYTFRVQAANNDGLWNTTGTSLSFQLRPHFYQTIWFYLLLLAFAAGLVFLAFRLRLLRAEREFRAVLAERNRIAREVHDTLAQGYVGVSVQLEVLSELLRNNKTDSAVRHLDTTRQHVREGLAEARQSIWALRSQDSGENTLPVLLRRATEHANGHGVEAAFSLYGAYRPMPPGTEREILRIGQEAIHNVKKHAGAKHLSVQLEYGPAEIALIVKDDGRGFESGNGTGSPPGHYGLTGMRERADLIGGTLDVTSELGAGTTVHLHLTMPKEARTEKMKPEQTTKGLGE